MRLAKLNDELVGEVLGTIIKSNTGQRLLNNGNVISEKLVERLIQHGMNCIYIEDENTDLKFEDNLDQTIRHQILTIINEIFDDIRKTNSIDEYKLTNLVRKKIFLYMSNEPITVPIGRSIKGDDQANHALNVCLLSVATGIRYGLNSEQLELLAMAALIHDIGKLLMHADDTLHHHKIAYDFLKSRISSMRLYNIIRFHHETLDGKGPEKLSADKQSPVIRILSLCNKYDNLLNDRNSIQYEAFEKIQALSKTKYDEDVFKAFTKAVYIYPIGLPVKLNTGEIGIISKQNRAFPLRPYVRTKENQYNLIENPSIFINSISI